MQSRRRQSLILTASRRQSFSCFKSTSSRQSVIFFTSQSHFFKWLMTPGTTASLRQHAGEDACVTTERWTAVNNFDNINLTTAFGFLFKRCVSPEITLQVRLGPHTSFKEILLVPNFCYSFKQPTVRTHCRNKYDTTSNEQWLKWGGQGGSATLLRFEPLQ